MNSRAERRREESRLRSARHRARQKRELEELKREAEKLRSVLRYLRANAPDHWLAVQPILHQETTEQPTNDLADPWNVLRDEDLFEGMIVNADRGEIQIPGLF